MKSAKVKSLRNSSVIIIVGRVIVGVGAVFGFCLLAAIMAGHASADDGTKSDRGVITKVLSPGRVEPAGADRRPTVERGTGLATVNDRVVKSVAVAPFEAVAPSGRHNGVVDFVADTTDTVVAHASGEIVRPMVHAVDTLGDTAVLVVDAATSAVSHAAESVVSDLGETGLVGQFGPDDSVARNKPAPRMVTDSTTDDAPLLPARAEILVSAAPVSVPEASSGTDMTFVWPDAMAGPVVRAWTGSSAPGDLPATPSVGSGVMTSMTSGSGQHGPTQGITACGADWGSSDVRWRGPPPEHVVGAWCYFYGHNHPS